MIDINKDKSNYPKEYDPALAKLFHSVDAFARQMKNKLARKHSEGSAGWDDPQNNEHTREMLLSHVTRGKGQEIDIANLAMILWYQTLVEEGKLKLPETNPKDEEQLNNLSFRAWINELTEILTVHGRLGPNTPIDELEWLNYWQSGLSPYQTFTEDAESN